MLTFVGIKGHFMWKSSICLFFLFVIFSCDQYEIEEISLPTEDGGYAMMYQVAEIHAPNLPDNQTQFQGTIGNRKVDLGRKGEETLVFIVPNVPGEVVLEVTIGNIKRSWNLLIFSSGQDEEIPDTFIEDFLKLNELLLAETDDIQSLVDFGQGNRKWMNKFKSSLAKLSPTQKSEVAQTLYGDFNSRLFRHSEENFKINCSQYANFYLGNWVGNNINHFSSFYSIQPFAFLPKNNFSDAILSGFGAGFWFQQLLGEYIAIKVEGCPSFRRLELMDAATKEVYPDNSTLILESGTERNFVALGIYSAYPMGQLELKSQTKTEFVNLLNAFGAGQGWNDLPDLATMFEFYSTIGQEEISIPLEDYRIDPYLESNANVRIAGYNWNSGKLGLTIESRDGLAQNFSMIFNSFIPETFRTNEVTYQVELKATCPLQVDILLEENKTSVDISFGEGPFQVVWNTGWTGTEFEKLPPGAYSVQVTDKKGCSKEVVFTMPEFGTVTDIAGNEYKTVKVGETWWMAENLRTDKKRTGESISLIENGVAWSNANEPAYTWLDNNPGYDQTFGKLYNSKAACCEICPEGWELPSEADLLALKDLFGIHPSRFLRAVNEWGPESVKSTNLSGLQILPSGFRIGSSSGGAFSSETKSAQFWISTITAEGLNRHFAISGFTDHLLSNPVEFPNYGRSIRCIKK